MAVNIKDFQNKGLVAIPYPADLRQTMHDMVDSWKNFCALPQEMKFRFMYTNEAGYELKEQPGERKDLKENFHIYLAELPRLQSIAEKIENKDALRFIYNADRVIAAIEPLISAFAESIEKEFSLPHFRDETIYSKPHWTLRFLHYFGNRREQEETATAHADKGGFTLHLFESDPGLQYLSWQKEWKEMPVSEGATVIIPGLQLQFRSENNLRALCHRVVATPETARAGRWSAVCFIDLQKTFCYNKNQKGRTQEYPPGFNYEISFNDLTSLFVPREKIS